MDKKREQKMDKKREQKLQRAAKKAKTAQAKQNKKDGSPGLDGIITKQAKRTEWKAYEQKSVMGRLSQLFLNEAMSDVEFTVKTPATTESMPAHSLILSISSEVFYKNFHSENFCLETLQNGRHHITITDIEPRNFRRLLHFIYTDKIKMDLDVAFEMISPAKKYNIRNLIQKCRNQFKMALDADQYQPTCVFELLQVAYYHDFEDLKDQALKAIQWREDSIDHESFFILDKDVFKLVVEGIWKVTSKPQRLLTRMIEFAKDKLTEQKKPTDNMNVRDYLADAVETFHMQKYRDFKKADIDFLVRSEMIPDGQIQMLMAGEF